MADIKLTPAQQAVVDDRGGALLVSAAAGSGKTKVLVDRLLKQICDPVCPANIDEFLVITYTKAAAAELRVKIAEALSKRLAEEPENRHLQRQLHRIYLAEISTVHAFCSGILRTYAHKLDIPADFRVAEEAESRSLRAGVLEDLLEEAYAEIDTDGEFRAMVETFGYGRDDRRLPQAVVMAHNQMRCRAHMEEWVEKNLQILSLEGITDVGETPWGKYLLDEFRHFLREQEKKLLAMRQEIALYPKMEKSLGKVFDLHLGDIFRLLTYETWDDFYYHPVTDFGRAGPLKEPEVPELKVRAGLVRDLFKDGLKARQKILCGSSGEMLADLRKTAEGTSALLRFAQQFDKIYVEEKQRRKLMDFSDLEHAAIRLLVDRHTGRPTADAREIGSRFREIMVDEYQDSNEIQETMFEALSKAGRNRFMVGDVKQSIYRFRLAEPEIFLGKYNTYPDHTAAAEGEPRRILLSENFRSRPEILAACNDVFRLVMRKAVGDLDYGDAEALRPGRAFPPVEGSVVELHCLSGDRSGDKRELEAEYVAQQIRTMLDEGTPVTEGEGTRPVRPSDIVILMRGLAHTASAYREALQRQGIPCVSERGGNLLDTSEVQILLSVLQIVDNPRRDVALLAAMASPVFGFTPEELGRIRLTDKEGLFYDAVRAAAEQEKVGCFLSVLEALRQERCWMTLSQLVDSILHHTGMEAVFGAMEDGENRLRDLKAFRRYVIDFEAGGSRSLTELLEHIAQLRESGTALPMPAGAKEDAVTLMTIHSSKGLEFPVVFLCDLSKKFNMEDLKNPVLVDQELSAGCTLVDQRRYVRYPTVATCAISAKKRGEAISEELRILYVAMTRPKDRLIMTYYSKSLESELKSLNSQLTMPLGDDVCANVACPGAWVLLAALCRTEAGELFALCGDNGVSRVSETPWKIVVRNVDGEADIESAPEEEFRREQPPVTPPVALAYAHRAACHVPAKLTATQLKGRNLDREAAEGAEPSVRPAPATFRAPTFCSGELTAAEKGTATHLFLQFASYSACTTAEGIEAEAAGLEQAAFLTPEQARAVDRRQVLTFFRSELGRWLLEQKQVHREFKFSLMADAGKWYPEAAGEQILLQGVVDCFVVEEDGITVLDFKTDRVADGEKYRGQLEAYGEALHRIFRLPVKKKLLYFFRENRVISV